MNRWIAASWGVACVAVGIGLILWVFYKAYAEGVGNVGLPAIVKNLVLSAGAISVGICRIRGNQRKRADSGSDSPLRHSENPR